MRNIFRWLVSNLGLILLSLVLAILVWTVAVEQENPTSEHRYSTPITVTIPDPPEGMMVYGQTNVQVYVTLRAPQLVWQSLRSDDFYATVDLDGLEEGIHTLPIQVQVDKRPVMIRGREPETISLHLERTDQAVVPISLHTEGNTALGFIARAASVDPLTTTIIGPASMVAQVVQVATNVSVEGGRADIEGEFNMEPLDAEGSIVPYLTLSPDKANVHVPIEQLSGFRDLAVTALVEGLAAPNYRISSITVSPPMVTVYGTPEVIDLIPGYLETAPLSLESAQSDIEVRLPLITPDGVSLLMEEPMVTVQVSIVPLEGSVTITRTVEIQGMVGITATVAPNIIEVILSGPLPVLEQLEEEDIRVIVDLFELNPGSHSVEPQIVIAPTEIVAESVIPSSVQVEITLLPPSPTPGRQP